MPYLYLFTIQNLTCNSDTHDYAFISKQKQNKLEKLKEGDITGCFNEFGLEKDLIENIIIIEFSDETFNRIISNYKDNIKIIKNDKYIDCIINDKIIQITHNYYKSGKKMYNNVGIYI